MPLRDQLAAFAAENAVVGKGPLCVMLVITRKAAGKPPPFNPEAFLAPKRGQVAGLGRAIVQTILAEHGIRRILAEEGGRTSRGSIERMRVYVSFLNQLHESGQTDFDCIERFWVERVKDYFASQPLRIKIDAAKGLRAMIAQLLEAAFDRQKASQGMMIAGPVMQHLVGAKLEIAIPGLVLEHHGAAVSDAQTGRKGDFLVGDTAIHVTSAPTERLLDKCRDNVDDNLRPVIVTTRDGLGGAEALAKNIGISERVDIFEIEQFLAANIHEWSRFGQNDRPVTIRELVTVYNRIIEQHETDPSLRIVIG